ncbi:MAG: hypothetical protein AB7S38_39070 [Vulcanimicrobiota bacterium]
MVASLALSSRAVPTDPALEAALARLHSQDWFEVRDAARALRSIGSPAVPRLLELLDSAETIPIGPKDLCTGYLFWYQFDYVSVRAGYTLEGLAFKDFGFADPDPKPTTPEQWACHRQAAAARARAWWAQQDPSWQRVDALEEALSVPSSGNWRALSFLNNESWARSWREAELCEGLTRDVYFDRIVPAVDRLRPQVVTDLQEQIDGLPHQPGRPLALSLDGLTPGPGVEDRELQGSRLELDGRVIARVGEDATRLAAQGPRIEVLCEDQGSIWFYETFPFQAMVVIVSGRIDSIYLLTAEGPWSREE